MVMQYYVDAVNGNDSWDGTSPTYVSDFIGPKKSITAGCGNSNTGDTINVAPGTYDVVNNESFPIALYGVIVKSSDVATTIVAPPASTGAFAFVVDGSIVDGFTINVSGGIYAINSSVYDIQIKNNIITNPTWGCGAINLTDGGRVLIENNTITADKGIDCGWLHYGGNTYQNNIVSPSNIGASGHGMTMSVYSDNTPNTITSNLVKDHAYSAGWYGGSIYVSGWYNGVFNITHNTVSNGGTGISAMQTTVTATDNILSGNMSGDSNGIRYYQTTLTETNNSIFNFINAIMDSTGAKTTPDVTDKLQDPFFYDAGSSDFRLWPASSCVGNGTSGSDIGKYGAVAGTAMSAGYVDCVNGNDASGDGSQALPWKTITHATHYTTSVIEAATGTYDVANGETFPIKLQAKINGTGVIVSEPTADVIQLVGPGVALNGLTINGGTTPATCLNVMSPGCSFINGTIYCQHVIDSGGQAIYINADDFEVGTSTITDNYGWAIYLTSLGTNANIHDNNITARTYIGGWGDGAIRLENVNHTTISNNTITNNYTMGIFARGGVCEYTTISGNTISAASRGIEVGNGQIGANSLVTLNSITPTTPGSGYGVDMNVAVGVTISYNTVVGWERGMQMNNGIVDHNTILKCKTGINYNGSGLVTNNIISAAPDLNTQYEDSIGITSYYGLSTNDYNCIFNNSANFSGPVSKGTHDITSCPKLTDVAGGDYRIFLDSPCKGAGTSGTDIGAYANSGTSSPYISDAYVDIVQGSDTTGDGSQGNPWATITKAMNNTIGTIHLADGTYATETFPLILTGGITVQPIDKNVTVTAIQQDCNGFIVGDNCSIMGLTINSTISISPWWPERETILMNGPKATLSYCNISTTGGITVNVQGPSCDILHNTLTNTDHYPIYAYANGQIVEIDNNIITSSNHCIVMDYNDYVTIKNNTITCTGATNCGILFGGAIWGPRYGCNIDGNTIIADHGIDIYSCINSGPIINNKISAYSANTSSHRNGITFNTQSSTYFSCVVSYNTVTGYLSMSSYGIYHSLPGDATVDHNTIVGCENGIGTDDWLHTMIQNNAIYGTNNGAGISGGVNTTTQYNDSYNNNWNWYGIAQGTGDISADPLFVSMPNQDYRLQDNSPCVGAGLNGDDIGAYGVIPKYKLLYIRSDGVSSSLIDSSGFGATGTLYNKAGNTTANPLFTSTSLELNALTNDYGTMTVIPQEALGTGDFTLEMWSKLKDFPVSGDTFLFLLGDQNMSPGSFELNLTSDSKMSFGWVTQQGMSGLNSQDLTGVIQKNTNYHLAAVRKNGNLSLYVQGCNVGTSACVDNIGLSSGTILIGAPPSSGMPYFDGYLQDIQFSNYAKYTSDFTPTDLSATTDSQKQAGTLQALGFGEEEIDFFVREKMKYITA